MAPPEPNLIRFSWEVSLGAVLSIVSFCATILIVAWRLGLRFNDLEKKVNVMFAAFLNQLSEKGVDVDALKRFFNGDTK